MKTPEPRFLCFPFDERAPSRPNARVLRFLRHGEAVHQARNAAAEARGAGCRCSDPDPGGGRSGYVCPYWSEDLVDAPLTALGREQMRGRGADFPVDVVLASPMSRTLETATLAFPEPVPVVALPELRPRMGRHMHSKRGTRSSLVARFPRVDLRRIPDEEDREWSADTEPRESLEERAGRFLEIVFSRPETHVAVVTHFTVLLALLLTADETYTLGPSLRAPGSPALLDGSGCQDPEALRIPVAVGEARSLVIVRA